MSEHSPTCLRLVNRHTGEVLELLRRRHNGELHLDLRGTLPAHQEGPPLHIHHLEDETGTVTTGTTAGSADG